MSSSSDPVVIVSAARTPLGALLGTLKTCTAPELGGVAIKAVVERAHLPFDIPYNLLMGCVLPAGQGQAPARQAALGAGLNVSTDCTTINKMCGSGMKAVMLAHDMLLANQDAIMIAGGMESMTNAPYLLDKARAGYRLGHQRTLDHLFIDGLEDAYEKGRLMGSFADDCAKQFSFTREIQDQFAITSTQRAQQSIAKGYFAAEIAEVTLHNLAVHIDEIPGNARLEKIPVLRPAFHPDGTVTAANASSIADGAAALLLMRRTKAEQLGLKPLATLVAHATHSQAPAQFTTAPIGAIQSLLKKTAWSTNEVDLFEINEAFAVVTLAAMQTLQLPSEKVNIHGGACALGHPIGASGARIVVTLLHALQQHNLKRGVAALCIGGGEATAIAIERH